MEHGPLSDIDADCENLADMQRNFAAFEKALPLIQQLIQLDTDEQLDD